MTMSTIPGIDEARITAWLRTQALVDGGTCRYEQVAGGRSNITVRIHRSTGASLILRRPPTTGILPSAHDMAREHTIISGLAHTDVPVPQPLGVCDDLDVTGAAFYVMEDVHGRVVRTRADAERLDADERTSAAESLVDTLATLHGLDVTQGPLAALGRADGYLERQLRRLRSQLAQSRTRELPLADEVADRLGGALPKMQRLALVHGDYRLDNVILGEDSKVRAVIDWELCTRGDPLADLGLLHVYWLETGDEAIPTLSSPTDLPGFASRATLVDRYAARTGLDVSDLPLYVGFGFWKLAVILEGVYSRFLAGAYTDEMGGYQQLGDEVPRLLERAAATLAAR